MGSAPVTLMQRDKVSLDIFWLKDESLEDMENLPDPDVLAAEIVENLQAALEQFSGILEGLEGALCQMPLANNRPVARPLYSETFYTHCLTASGHGLNGGELGPTELTQRWLAAIGLDAQ